MNLEADNNFLYKLFKKNKYFRDGIYKIVGDVKNGCSDCVVEDEFGCIHKIICSYLLPSCRLTIKSAVDKNAYLIELLKSKDFYKGYCIVGEYFNNNTPIQVQTKYGICKVSPMNLLQGNIPTIRSAVDKTSYFSNMAKEIHGELYDYSQVKWESATKKINILCNVDGHGLFAQTPNNHLSGKGCDKCRMDNRKIKAIGWSLQMWEDSAKRSNNFDSFKVYIIRCWDEEEEFYKIGRTFTTVEERYKNRFKYNYEIINQIVMTSEDCYQKEIELRQNNKSNKYTPLKKFNGYTECYKNINTNE